MPACLTLLIFISMYANIGKSFLSRKAQHIQITVQPSFHFSNYVNVNKIQYKSKSSTQKSFVLFSIMERMYTYNTGYDSKSDLVLDDFDQILDALYIFGKEFGDYDIPYKFEVPPNDPWPSHLHGLRLGKRLEKLLTTQEFFDNHPSKVKDITNLGLVADVSSLIDDWTMTLKAVKAYREIYGDLRVPSKFVVPFEDPWPRVCRGHKLGARLSSIRSAGRFVKDHPERKAELDRLGFEWRMRDNTYKQQVGEDLFEQVYEALKCYKNIYKDLNIPLNFTVPVEDTVWPVSTWNLTLGAIAKKIRDKDKLVFGHTERENLLKELGFFEESGRAVHSRKRFDLLYNGLVTYKQLYGNLSILQSFEIPAEAPWDEETWGLKLGARVNAVRSSGTFVLNRPDRRKQLDEIGFEWELPSDLKKKKKAQQDEKESEDMDGRLDNILENGDHLSSDGGYPSFKSLAAKSKDINLEISKWMSESDGTIQESRNQIKNLQIPSKFRGESKSVLSYDPSRMFQPVAYREIAAEAMKEYIRSREYSTDPDVREIGHFENHLTPEQYHKVITRQIPPEEIKNMKKIGYKILEFGRFYWDDFLAALRIYKEHFGDVNVPQSFVIDERVIASHIGFPERLEDMRLGEHVASIRIGDIDGLEMKSRRKVLDELGFDWGDKSVYQRYRFIPMMLGLKVFRHLYGFPLPHDDFIVPEEPQWPYWMTGMPLGLWTAVARVQQQMIIEHYPNRYDMLNKMEFMWWIPPGDIPQKYFHPVT